MSGKLLEVLRGGTPIWIASGTESFYFEEEFVQVASESELFALLESDEWKGYDEITLSATPKRESLETAEAWAVFEADATGGKCELSYLALLSVFADDEED